MQTIIEDLIFWEKQNIMQKIEKLKKNILQNSKKFFFLFILFFLFYFY